MFSVWSKVVSFLAMVAIASNAQITYLTIDQITAPAWTGSVSPVLAGNGVFLSPDGALAVVVSNDASLKAFDQLNGAVVWEYRPTSTTATTTGGAFFCYTATVPYLVYSYTDGGVSFIVAINPTDGSEILITGSVPGIVAGTPVTSEDGQYILATSNVDGSKGYFTIFDITSPTTPVLAYDHPSIDDEPFGAVGYYWSPVQGNFPGGEANTNDVFIWSFDTNVNVTVNPNATVGVPQIFAFQFPTNDLATLNVTLLDGDRDYQSKLAPVITDGGLSMYWPVSRARVYAWIGDGSGRTDFTTNGVTNNLELARGEIRSSSSFTQPSLSNSTGADGFVVGTGPSAEIFRIDRNFSSTPTIVATVGIVTSRLLVSPDDQFVYYATPAPDSSLYQVESTGLTQSWKLTPSSSGIEGHIAQSLNGARIIMANTAGEVTAFTVATADEVTVAPIVATPVAPTVPVTPTTSPPVSGPPVTTGPSVTLVPSDTGMDTMGPSTTPVPSTTLPTTVKMPSVGSPAGTTPTAPTPARAPSAPVPTSDAWMVKNLFFTSALIVAVSLMMFA